jgi:hypothetical protein
MSVPRIEHLSLLRRRRHIQNCVHAQGQTFPSIGRNAKVDVPIAEYIDWTLARPWWGHTCECKEVGRSLRLRSQISFK